MNFVLNSFVHRLYTGIIKYYKVIISDKHALFSTYKNVIFGS